MNAGDETLKARLTGIANKALDKTEKAIEEDDPETANQWLGLVTFCWVDEESGPSPTIFKVTVDDARRAPVSQVNG